MKRLFLLPFLLVILAASASTQVSKEAERRLDNIEEILKAREAAHYTHDSVGEMTVKNVPTFLGFEYFSGHLAPKKDYVPDFITMYTYRNYEERPKIRLVGKKVEQDFSIRDIDKALEMYRLLLLNRWSRKE